MAASAISAAQDQVKLCLRLHIPQTQNRVSCAAKGKAAGLMAGRHMNLAAQFKLCCQQRAGQRNRRAEPTTDRDAV